jgi:effector-binding domain-containing protein
MSYKCEVIAMTSQSTLAIRSQTTFHHLPRTIGDALSALKAYLTSHDWHAAGPMYVRYAGAAAPSIDVEIGVPVRNAVVASGAFEASAIPECRAASCVHRGHYTDLPHAYKALEQWIESLGAKSTGVAYELYLNDPEHTPPTAWLTQVALPLR